MSQPRLNSLLEALPPAYRARLMSMLHEVELPVQSSQYRPYEEPKYGHFITSGVTSLVTSMENGAGIEVGLIGCEGLVEALHLISPLSVPTSGFTQIGGTALRMPLGDLRAEFLIHAPLRGLILRLIQRQNAVGTQLAACNRLHEVEERLSRWLLMLADRVESSRFAITQEFLAEMIGTGRTTVTTVAGNLQRGGLIEYHRGVIHILDRHKLEQTACECYPIVQSLMAGLYQ